MARLRNYRFIDKSDYITFALCSYYNIKCIFPIPEIFLPELGILLIRRIQGHNKYLCTANLKAVANMFYDIVFKDFSLPGSPAQMPDTPVYYKS